MMAIILGYWRYTVAQETAEDLFDRSLLATALALSRDVAISGGDAVLPSTIDLIRDVTGGDIFYHVTGPGGIYVTGYAYPPVVAPVDPTLRYTPTYYRSTYRNDPVRVLRITEVTSLGDLTGDSTVTVWQSISERKAFAQELALRAGLLIGVLLLTLSLVVWFGVKLGLRPLLDLQDAIAARSPDDLSAIKRTVPVEVRGIVATLDRLFKQVETSISAHQVFISDAAHQLRNPAAAVSSMAEAVREAKSKSERNKRVAELIKAAESSARVTEQLLSLDRLRQDRLDARLESFNLNDVVEDICASYATSILRSGLEFELEALDRNLTVHADRVLVSEAVKNLIDNALKHGGANLTSITVQTGREGNFALVTISDDGVALSPEDTDKAFSRFGQIEPGIGSGMGLVIVASVADRHGGLLRINAVDHGASITLGLPMRTEPVVAAVQ
jgi:two-component system sensor histidine kinase TctE